MPKQRSPKAKAKARPAAKPTTQPLVKDYTPRTSKESFGQLRKPRKPKAQYRKPKRLKFTSRMFDGVIRDAVDLPDNRGPEITNRNPWKKLLWTSKDVAGFLSQDSDYCADWVDIVCPQKYRGAIKALIAAIKAEQKEVGRVTVLRELLIRRAVYLAVMLERLDSEVVRFGYARPTQLGKAYMELTTMLEVYQHALGSFVQVITALGIDAGPGATHNRRRPRKNGPQWNVSVVEISDDDDSVDQGNDRGDGV